MAKRKRKGNELAPRCGRIVVGKPSAADGSVWKCVRPAGHRGICAVRSADLERHRWSAESTRARMDAARIHPTEAIRAFLQRGQAAQSGVDGMIAAQRAIAELGDVPRSAAERFAECAVELGLSRATAILARMRSAAAELRP